MRSIIIAGSRSLFLSVQEIDAAIARLDPSGLLWVPEEWEEVICGDADGMDMAGAAWAEAKRKAVKHDPVTEADRKRWGKYLAPKVRNHRMGLKADGALVFWNRRSGGSADMIARMVLFRKPVEALDFGPQRPRALTGELFPGM